MNVQAGATVGFLTAAGGLAGAMFGAIVGGLLESKATDRLTTYGAGAGALMGAFIGGTIVTTTPTAPAVGTAGAPPQLAP